MRDLGPYFAIYHQVTHKQVFLACLQGCHIPALVQSRSVVGHPQYLRLSPTSIYCQLPSRSQNRLELQCQMWSCHLPLPVTHQ